MVTGVDPKILEKDENIYKELPEDVRKPLEEKVSSIAKDQAD